MKNKITNFDTEALSDQDLDTLLDLVPFTTIMLKPYGLWAPNAPEEVRFAASYCMGLAMDANREMMVRAKKRISEAKK